MSQQPPALAQLTTIGLGGPASRFDEVHSPDDVAQAAAEARHGGHTLQPLGGGSNLVVADTGVDAWVLHMKLEGLMHERQGDHVLVTAGAGVNWHSLVVSTTENGLAGLECLGGIPGSVGAAPIQNVGAYGQEVAETVERLTAFDLQSNREVTLAGSECDFGYRNSRFKQADRGRYIVLSVTFRLAEGGAPAIRYGELRERFASSANAPNLREVRDAVVDLRRAKSMVLDPESPNARSCGSFFVNCVVDAETLERIERVAGNAAPAFATPDGRFKVASAWLIERAGLTKGFRRGRVGLSTKHTLALVAHDGARTRDLLELAHHVRSTVQERFGVTLVPEPNFWGFSDLDDGLPRLV